MVREETSKGAAYLKKKRKRNLLFNNKQIEGKNRQNLSPFGVHLLTQKVVVHLKKVRKIAAQIDRQEVGIGIEMGVVDDRLTINECKIKLVFCNILKPIFFPSSHLISTNLFFIFS